MAKQNGDPSCGATSSEASCNTVFIDTNLGTHLAMIVFPSDTVLDLKTKIMSEHPECFPECGKITVNALKVKRKGFLYHLADSMIVKNAFGGDKKCWFLFVDASSLKQPNENQTPKKSEGANELPLVGLTKTTSGDSSKHRAISSSNKINNNHVPGISNEVQKDPGMEVTNVAADPCPQVFSDFNCGLYDTSQNQKQLSERNVVAETNVRFEGGDSRVYLPERSTRNECGINKKRKFKKDKAAISNFILKDDVDVDEHSSGKTVIGTPEDTTMENLASCNIVSGSNEDLRVDDSRVVVDDIHSNSQLEGSLRSKPGAKRKHKSKKKTRDSVSHCTVENYVGTNEHLSDKRIGEVPIDVKMANSDAVKGPCSTSCDDGVLRPNAGEFHKESPEARDDVSKKLVPDVQGNSPPEDTSKSIPASKKRKRSKSKGAGNLLEENNETPMKDAIAPNSSVISEQNNSTATETLITKTPQDVGLVAGTSSGRRKKKKRSSRNQEVFVEPPSSQNAGEESGKDDVETVAMNVDNENAEKSPNDIGNVSDSAVVPESNVQLERPHSGVGMHVMEHNVASAEVKSASPELVPESGSKRTKKSKKGHSTNLNELSSPVVTEFGNLKKDVVISAGENSIHDDGHGPDKVVEQREWSPNFGNEEMVSEKCEKLIQDGASKDAVASAKLSCTNINMEHDKSSGSKRLKKRANKPVSVKAVVSNAECSDNTAISFSPSASYDINTATKKTMSPLSQTDIPKPNLLDTSLDDANGACTNKSQENEDIVQINLGKGAEIALKRTEVSAAKSRENMKSNQTSNDETHSLPVKGQKVGAEELISSNDRDIEAKNASTSDKKRKPGKSRSKNKSIGKDLESDKNIGEARGAITLVADSTQAPSSDKLRGDSIEKPLVHVGGCDENRQVVVSKSKDDGINFKDGGESSIEPVVNAVQKSRGSEIAIKAKKRSTENGGERKFNLKNSAVIDQKDAKKPTLSTKKEIKRKVSSDTNRATVAKSSSKGMGRVVNRNEKSLLATPASIFWDNSSESSEDSETSTKAPSDNSSSSSDSEEEGADGAGGADYGRSKMETITPISKYIDMNAILRGSSRFKKVKASTAQSQLEDTESQPVDFVPDSEPIE